MTADAVGGVWTFALELAAGLAGHGTETALVVLGPPPGKAQLAAAAAIPGLEVMVPGLDLEWRDRAALGADAASRLRALARAFRPDLVHINGFREAACGWDAPVLLAAHSCVRSWWHACRGGEPPAAEWGAYLAGVRAGLRAADAVVAPTTAFLAELALLYGPLPPARAIHNGRRLDIPTTEHRPVVLAAGRLWDEAKGLADLAAVAEWLPWPVLAAGDPGAEPPGGISHLGELSPDRLLRHMAEAEIFAAPARYEPFGLSILEAAATGAALVLGDLPTLRELWDGAARFVPPGDRLALRAALLELIGDDPARRALQEAARSRARAYGRVRMIEGYLAFYAELSGPALRREHAA
jgi:glycosyltransferase involved in cell wall biosynthesis